MTLKADPEHLCLYHEQALVARHVRSLPIRLLNIVPY
jgi:hypothetical protein